MFLGDCRTLALAAGATLMQTGRARAIHERASSHSAMRPSETSAGLQWLENFTATDRFTAVALLDSLRFVELSTLHRALTALLRSSMSNGLIPSPALVLPERSLR